MKEFLEYILKSIVSAPDQISVTETKDGDLFIYNLKVAKEDMGTVIGKEGKNIKGIRNMAKAKAIKDNIMIRIILEDDKDEN